MAEDRPPEPTAEQCTARAALPGGWVACWYPQMGGYVAKAAVLGGGSGCAEVLVWHDGDFPFAGDDGSSPRLLHHCDGQQFVDFGWFLQGLWPEGRPADAARVGVLGIPMCDAAAVCVDGQVLRCARYLHGPATRHRSAAGEEW
jgi:hypothetical protein